VAAASSIGRSASPAPARTLGEPPPFLRFVAVGASDGPICGVRDHATLLAHGLEQAGAPCSLQWLYRSIGSQASMRAQMRDWTRRLEVELAAARPDVVLLHYSVFTLSYRGLPLYVNELMGALRRAGAPVIGVMHELAYPWRHGGWRGKVWSVSQRVALRGVVRGSAALLVTADFRDPWLKSRLWLPERPVMVAPVYSNLPSPSATPIAPRDRPVVGLFGYAYQGAAIALILDALARLAHAGEPPQLLLLGAPGENSAPAQEWRALARERGIADSIAFSGTLAPQPLSDALAGCDLLLFADEGGPSSRKGSLAGSLASGRPVVALDGRRRWAELDRAHALEVVEPRADALAGAIGSLLADGERREALGARGRAFAAERMSVAATVSAVLTLARSVNSAGG
jgi:glycosyltransferase involved in cell wall biosynthesis